MRLRRVHYYSHHGRRKHPTTVLHRFATGIVLPVALVVAAGAIVTTAWLAPATYTVQAGTLVLALGASMLRLLAAYALALLIGVPLGLLAERSRRFESVLLPIYDVMESLPVLAFFPIIILFFLDSGLLEGAAVFMIFFTILWTISFSTIGGMHQIPEDVRSAGRVFGLSAWHRLTRITLPALFPPLLTASILGIADGWNIVIVAETLHAYAPVNSHAADLFGIGSILVNASTNGNNALLLSAMGLLVVTIAVVNLALWQPLLARAERFKFE
ncbi:MAG TPA: ABC transporter permease subunit [Candidatus Paceibacterota bacterium]